MKKYDLYIAGTYLIAFFTIVILIFYYRSEAQTLKKEVADLYSKPSINQVIISDFEGNWIVVHTEKVPYDRKDWSIHGYMHIYKTEMSDRLKIEDNILYISGLNSNSFRYLYLHKDIPIKLENSSGVKIMSDKEFQASLAQEKN